MCGLGWPVIATDYTESTESTVLLEEELSYEIRGAVFEVSRHLGHGFLERVYERALHCELGARGLKVTRQVPLLVRYKGKDGGEYVAEAHRLLTPTNKVRAFRVFGGYVVTMVFGDIGWGP